jgi:regulatory protein
MRSKHEIATYLRRKDYDDELATQVIGELEQRRLIDDQRFAAQWIEERNLLSPRSRYQLRGELREKGLATDVIETALEAVDREAEIASVATLITTKRLLQRYQDPRKLINHLASKGFPIDTIKAALKQLADGESTD